MRNRIISAALGPAVLCSCTSLPSDPTVPAYIDTAEVILAQPLYKPVQVTRPVNECWTEHVRRAEPVRNAFAGPVAGGVIGGLIGHSLSRGQGKTPETVAGALVGPVRQVDVLLHVRLLRLRPVGVFHGTGTVWIL